MIFFEDITQLPAKDVVPCCSKDFSKLGALKSEPFPTRMNHFCVFCEYLEFWMHAFHDFYSSNHCWSLMGNPQAGARPKSPRVKKVRLIFMAESYWRDFSGFGEFSVELFLQFG